jgi:hypothetical protein
LIVPVIDEWMVQWYGYEPAKLIAFENELPPFRRPEFQSESGAFWVVVCVIVSLFVQWNVSPNARSSPRVEAGRSAHDRDVHRFRACLLRHRRNRDVTSINAIERRISTPLLRFLERCTVAGPARMVR